MNRTILWCIGSPILLDDGVGPALFAELEAFPAEGITPVNCETTPENHIAPLRKNPPRVLIVADAADLGLPGGSVRRMSLEDTGDIPFSSHGIPLSLLLEPFRDTMEIIVIGIQPARRGFGDRLSPEAADAVKRVADALRSGRTGELERYQENRSPR
ncbi:hydrogenase maturation protease [Aminivibrio sp.]|jgi:hydrogenase 3 maturation protease|uniref:hydrogenase maturation protease n=1 Tax=Aminivibrio sp. TaxID=1872489 RepID=UPI001A434B1E|nr:hydrogenase maturation protease [Aminivibrio sp.]MBL3539076.1 hydrogenase maturation protease [Aminivibrio sp.]